MNIVVSLGLFIFTIAMEVSELNSRDDRSYIIGKTWEFTNFEEAKLFFIKKNERFYPIE